MSNNKKEYIVKQIETLDNSLSKNKKSQYILLFLTSLGVFLAKINYDVFLTIADDDLSLETILGDFVGFISLFNTLGFGFLSIESVLSFLEIIVERALLKNEKRKLLLLLEERNEKENRSR